MMSLVVSSLVVNKANFEAAHFEDNDACEHASGLRPKDHIKLFLS